MSVAQRVRARVVNTMSMVTGVAAMETRPTEHQQSVLSNKKLQKHSKRPRNPRLVFPAAQQTLDAGATIACGDEIA